MQRRRPRGAPGVAARGCSKRARRDWRGWASCCRPTTRRSRRCRSTTSGSRARYRVAAPPWEVARHLVDKTLLLDARAGRRRRRPALLRPGDRRDRAAARPPLPGAREADRRATASRRASAASSSSRATARELRRCDRAAGARRSSPATSSTSSPDPTASIYAYCTYVDARGEPRGGRDGAQAPAEPALLRRARASPRSSSRAAELREATLALLAPRIGFRGIAARRVQARSARRPLPSSSRSTVASVLYNALLRARRASTSRRSRGPSTSTGGASSCAPPTRLARACGSTCTPICSTRCWLRRDERLAARATLVGAVPPAVHRAVWSARDPAPFLAQWGRSARARRAGALGPRAARARWCGRRTSRPILDASAGGARRARRRHRAELSGLRHARARLPRCTSIVGSGASRRSSAGSARARARREGGLVERRRAQLEAARLVLRQLVLQHVAIVLEQLPDRARVDEAAVVERQHVLDPSFELGQQRAACGRTGRRPATAPRRRRSGS